VEGGRERVTEWAGQAGWSEPRRWRRTRGRALGRPSVARLPAITRSLARCVVKALSTNPPDRLPARFARADNRG
jgi:hypothetical protein